MDFSVITTVYYFIFLVLFALFICNESMLFSVDNRVIKISSGISIFILTFFSGLRWETGTDWDNYYNFFNDIYFSNINAPEFYHYDFGYKIFNALIHSFTSSYTIFLIIDTFVAVYLIYVSLKKMESKVFLGLSIFYANYYISTYLGSNRRIIAIGLATLAVVYFFLEKRKSAIICLAIGVVFHWTAIVAIIAFFVPKKLFGFYKLVIAVFISCLLGFSKYVISIISGILNLMSLVGLKTLSDTGRFYLLMGTEDLGISHFAMAVIKRILVLAIIYFIYHNLLETRTKKMNYFINLYSISTCAYMALNGMGVIQIITVYFAIMEIFMWSEIYKNLNSKNRIYIIVIIFVIYTMEAISSFPVYKELYLPYKWVL